MVGVSKEKKECTVGRTTQERNEETARKLLLEAFRLATINVTDDTFDTIPNLGDLCNQLSPDVILTAAKKLKIKSPLANLVTIERLSESEYPPMASWRIEGRLPSTNPKASAPPPEAKWTTHPGVKVKTL